MASVDSALSSESGRTGRFLTTHWSVVLKAGQGGSLAADEALARLCQTYWYPLYAFLRRQGQSPENAQDLIQGFFAQLLEKNYLSRADPKRGRFRSFLLASVKHYLANEIDREQAVKRGGPSAGHVSFDEAEAENRYLEDPKPQASPEILFDRQWALTVLDQALDRLRAELAAAGKGVLFEALKPCLTGDRLERTYTEIGTELAMSEGALKVLVHRMRQRFGALIRAQVAETLVNPAQIEEEMKHLLGALSD